MALRGLSVIGCRLSEVSVHVVDSGHARRRPLQYRLHDHRQRAQRRQPTTDNARSAGATLRKDIVIAIAGIVIVAAICFGLAIMKPDFKPFSSKAATSTATSGPEHVIMHVNGEPVTEAEFQAAYAQLPDEVKQQFASEAGKQAF